MKKWFLAAIALFSVIALFLVVTPGRSRLKSYYSGDAISYQNRVYIASANSGSLEVFRLDENNLNLLAKTKSYNPRFNNYDDFFDAKLNVENNRLYVYAVSHYTLYKYELVGADLNLVNKSTNTYWEWYNRVDKFGNDIVTVSAKGIKIFNTNLDLIVAHDFKNIEAPYNVSGSNPRFFLNVDESKNAIEVYDREARTIVSTIPVNFKFDKGNRRAYQDAAGYIYVVDDYYTKKFDVSGKLLAHFQHLDFQGFDVAASGHNNYIYFSNGVGVVKLNNQNMELIDYAWTGNLGGQAGWAMGLKVVYNNGDKIVIFNNTNILVLNDKLEKIASIAATEQGEDYPLENLFLRLDKPSAAANSTVLLSGGGFLPKEQLNISFNNIKQTTTTTDSNGRFSVVVTIPDLRTGSYDIKTEGLKSQLHYSISFKLE